jgi:uncharacterized membrane protein YjgN (DUF898 family)
MTAADGAMPALGSGAVAFIGKEAAYWRLRIKGAALLMVTFGLYRFWFATDVRRYLWSSTEIGGDTLEYTGLPTELLGGFLLAVAILAPLYTAIASAALALDSAEQAIAAIAFVLLMLLGEFALYRARRYRLTRTVFRGVRFDQHGSPWRYAIYALSWWILVVVTLGLAYPWAQASLQRFKMRHTCYGDLAGEFAGSGTTLFLRGLPIWLLVVAPLIVALLSLAGSIDWDALGNARGGGNNDATAQIMSAFLNHGFRVVSTAVGISVVAGVLLYPLFQAMVLRWWISGLRFGAMTVTSRLRTVRVYRIYLRFVLLTLLFLLLIAVVAALGIFAGKVLMKPSHDSTELLTTAAMIGLYVVIALGISTIYQVAVTFSIWRCGVQSAELAGSDVLEAVRASGAASSALGEGLADALGVGGI